MSLKININSFLILSSKFNGEQIIVNEFINSYQFLRFLEAIFGNTCIYF